MASDDGLVSFSEAAARSGLDRRSMFSRAQAPGIAIYEDGHDRRRRLIAERDIPRLTAPRLVERRETVTGETRQ